MKGRNRRATSGQSNKALHFRREIVPKVDHAGETRMLNYQSAPQEEQLEVQVEGSVKHELQQEAA